MDMYVGVDIGGTKTLIAALNDQGVIVETLRFPTPAKYPDFLDKLREATGALKGQNFRAGSVAAPGHVDRDRGRVGYFGNLHWQHTPIQADTEKLFRCPMLIENDANLGGLSEAMLLPADKRILYITVSTGIGTGFIEQRHIIPELADSEGGQMLLEHHGKLTKWEDFASGRAIVARFGKKASDITDAQTWQRIAHDLALGFIELMAIAQPDVIVVGGGAGAYFERFEQFLRAELERYKNPLIKMPELRKAARPDEAVLYGCYDLARMAYGRDAA